VSAGTGGMGLLLQDLRSIRQAQAVRKGSAETVARGYVAGIFLLTGWLVFFLWPTAGAFAGTHGLKYAALAAVVALGYLAANAVPTRLLPTAWLVWALLTGVVSGISYTVFMHELSFGDGTYVARPFFFAFALGLAYVVGSWASSPVTLTAKIRPLVIAMLMLQTGVAITQALGLGVLDAVYSADKVSPLGGALRITGTIGNPNLFAYHILLAISFLAAHSNSNRGAFSWLAFGLLLVLLSGSRTVLLLYPPAAMVIVRLRSRDSLLALLKLMLPVVATLAVGGYLVFMLYAEYFPYIGQLVSLFAAGEVLGFRAFALRIAHWSSVWSEIGSGNIGQWLFGRFDGTRFGGAIDNDLLFILWRQGLVGLLSTLTWYMLAIATIHRICCRVTRKLLYLWLVVIIFFSIMFESIAGWWIPFIIMMVMGLYLGATEGRTLIKAGQ